MGTKKHLKSQLRKDGDFVPPDGGWGWMIIFAAGFSNLSTLPTLQQFGLLFRDKLSHLGISSSETTTIININAAFASCVGLANGPVFRKFTYRQVSFTGATVVFVSLIMTTFSYSFATYLIFFSILYGAGCGITSSANALALNTYWKEKRRLATGLSWTTTGLGPIIWPQLITISTYYFGEDGTILLISGFSLHAIACALLLHPVEWHEKKRNVKPSIAEERSLLDHKEMDKHINNKDKESGYFSSFSKLRNLSAFSSQYLYNEDDPDNPGYEIIDPGVPMMTRANDGYFSQSRQSKSKMASKEGSTIPSRMNSKKPSMTNLTENQSRKTSTLYLNESKKNSMANLGVPIQERETYKSKRKNSISLGTQIPESEIEDCPTLKAPHDLKGDEKEVVEKIDPKEAKYIADRAKEHTAKSKSVKSFKMDGQYSYGDKYNRDNQSNVSLKNTDENVTDERTYVKDNHSVQSVKGKYRKKSNNFNYESEVLKLASLKLEEYLKENETKSTYEKIKLLINGDIDENDDNDDVFETTDSNNEIKGLEEHKDVERLTLCQKIAIFFDFDLLKDFTYVNLMVGLTLATFNELNFSLLTPFILADYGFSKHHIALFMSILAGVDISMRFAVPFIAGKLGWDNNSFFLLGVLSMALGRVVLAYNHSLSVAMAVAVIIGFGKGLRTVFMALVIPTYVPLHKLPGATGIQLLTAGIVYLSLGPVVGWIKDNARTETTLHCLNIFTYLTALSWTLEKYINSRKQKNLEEGPLNV